MRDKSGRECVMGDLMLGLGRKKGHLDDLEYSIVVSEGKVFNGSMVYTIGDAGYKCVLTSSEIDIQRDLQVKYKQLMMDKVNKKNIAKQIKLGTLFEYGTSGDYYLYIGKVLPKLSYHKGELVKVYEKGGHGYIRMQKSKYVWQRNTQLSAMLDNALTNGELDISLVEQLMPSVRSVAVYSGSFNTYAYDCMDVLVRASKVEGELGGIVGELKFKNWEINDSFKVKLKVYNEPDNYLTVTRLK